LTKICTLINFNNFEVIFIESGVIREELIEKFKFRCMSIRFEELIFEVTHMYGIG